MAELRSVGRKMTWSNGHVHSELDRALTNLEWVQHMLYLEAVVMDPGFSNHTPISILVEEEVRNVGRPFKFFNVLASHDKFNTTVAQSWNGNEAYHPMKVV